MEAAPAEPLSARVARRLRDARLQARLTVREAARQAGLESHATVVKYENGAGVPLDRLGDLARVYAVAPPALLTARDELVPLLNWLEHATPEELAIVHAIIDEVRSRHA